MACFRANFTFTKLASKIFRMRNLTIKWNGGERREYFEENKKQGSVTAD
jgi:hypothetical protein